MALRKKHCFLGILLFALFTSSYASDDLRSLITNLENQSTSQQSSIDNVRKTLNEKTIEIEKMKSGDHGIVSKIFLQKKLREAQFISKELESLVRKQASLNEKLRTERTKLLNQINVEIANLTKKGVTNKASQFQQLHRLINEKDRILYLQHQTLTAVPEFSLSSAQNNRDDLIEKLQVIEDLQKNMKQKIAFLKEELEEEQSREFLRSEVAHFLDEERFFGEQSFISSGLNRKESTTNPAVLALQKDTSKDTAPSDQPIPSDTAPETDPSSDTPAPVAEDSTAMAETQIEMAPPVSSQSTAFQQPQDMHVFQNLLDQVQETIRETDSKTGKQEMQVSKKELVIERSSEKLTKKRSLQQNLALSEKILSDLDTLHDRLTKQVQELR